MTVRKPPIRSAMAPQNWRETNAQPNSTESIPAPCPGLMPMSEQYATRCELGIAIGMQQQKPATQISPCTTLGRSPSTDRSRPALTAGPELTGIGTARSNGSNGGMQTSTTAPYASIAACQP